MLYLIVKAIALNDQYECDADRTPILVTQDEELALSYLEKNETYEIYYGEFEKRLKKLEIEVD